MVLFNKNPNEVAYIGGKKHWADVIKKYKKYCIII